MPVVVDFINIGGLERPYCDWNFMPDYLGQGTPVLHIAVKSSITSENEALEISTGFGLLDQGDFLLSLEESALGYEIKTDNNGVLRVSSAHDGPRETAAAVVNDVMILAREGKAH